MEEFTFPYLIRQKNKQTWLTVNAIRTIEIRMENYPDPVYETSVEEVLLGHTDIIHLIDDLILDDIRKTAEAFNPTNDGWFEPNE